jgi:hypothetical protein
MTSNSFFPNPTPPLALIRALNAALQAAEVAVLEKTRGKATLRDDRAKELRTRLIQLKGYVQSVADEDPDRAGEIIESAGMSVKRRVLPNKPPFDARPGPVAGSVRLIARAVAKEANYEWAWSLDGATWQRGAITRQANRSLYGLPSEKKCWFRFRATTRRGQGDWCDPVACMVP